MRRMVISAIAAGALLLASGSAVLADPSFGPGAGNGQGNNRPQDNGAACHPPGQTSGLVQCK